MTQPRLKKAVRDVLLILAGSLIYAIGVDSFEIPYGLAAGGVTGLATVFQELAARGGVQLPVGMQTIAMNVLLLAVVVRSGNRGYIWRTVVGIVACGVLTDVVAAVAPALGTKDYLLCALWGGVITGVGLGLVFRTGGNTGGTDIVAQLISRHTAMGVGTACMIVDGVIIAFSALVFSVEQALYAAVAMYISGKVIDAVVDGPRSQRAAYIVSKDHERIAQLIMNELERGCTELTARGMWSGESRPVLFCVLGRAETVQLKEIVAECDPDAIVFISEVHEAFGEGFKQIEE